MKLCNQISKARAFWFQTKIFKGFPYISIYKTRCGHGGHLGFPIETILASLDLYVTPMLPTKFGVNWLLGLRVKAKNSFEMDAMVAIFSYF